MAGSNVWIGNREAAKLNKRFWSHAITVNDIKPIFEESIESLGSCAICDCRFETQHRLSECRGTWLGNHYFKPLKNISDSINVEKAKNRFYKYVLDATKHIKNKLCDGKNHIFIYSEPGTPSEFFALAYQVLVLKKEINIGNGTCKLSKKLHSSDMCRDNHEPDSWRRHPYDECLEKIIEIVDKVVDDKGSINVVKRLGDLALWIAHQKAKKRLASSENGDIPNLQLGAGDLSSSEDRRYRRDLETLPLVNKAGLNRHTTPVVNATAQVTRVPLKEVVS